MKAKVPSALWLVLVWSFGLSAIQAFAQAPANDNFAQRFILSGPLPITATGSNVSASAEFSEPNPYSNGARASVWWSWTADRDGGVIVSPTTYNFDHVFAVYESTVADTLAPMDNADASGVTVTGDWTTSTTVPGFFGTNYLHDGNTGKGTKSVRFTPTITTAGNYDVYLRWPADSNRATNVPVDVVHNGGTSTYHVNQRTGGNGWVQINDNGPVSFAAGTGGSILIRTDGTADGYVVADAVRLVPSATLSTLNRVGSGDYSASFVATAGKTYYIVLDSYSYYSGTGNVTFQLFETPAITSATNAFGTIGKPFSYQIKSNVSATSYSAYYLPTGVTLNSSTGLISGTPIYTGDYYIYLTAYGPSNTASGNVTIHVGDNRPRVTNTTGGNATEGQLFNYQITATNDPTSYTAFGLPSGLTLDASTGVISGTPTTFGDFYLELIAGNSYGNSPSVYVTIHITSARPTVTGGSAAATVGTPFNYQIVADKNPTSYSASDLPDGLTVNTATGLITGTPTISGTFQVTLSASNSFGPRTATLQLDIYDAGSDNFATRGTLNGEAFSLFVSNAGATKEDDEPNHAGESGGASLWWKWKAPKTGLYRFTFSASPYYYPPLIAVYQGTTLKSLRPVASNSDEGSGRPETFILKASAGQQYQIAVDTEGGGPAVVNVDVEYLGGSLAKLLTVSMLGRGSVTPGYQGTSYHKVGDKVTITATPAPGYIFTAWNGAFYSDSPRLTFTMPQDDTFLEADFEPNPFLYSTGTFFGVLDSGSSPASAGTVKISVSLSGAFTATVVFGGKTYQVRGTLDYNGAFSVVIPRGRLWPLTISGQIDLGDPAAPFRGTVEDDQNSASFRAERSSFSAKMYPAPQVGKYTLSFGPGGAVGANGYGYAIVTVTSGGAVRLTGVLPDGSPITQGSNITDEGKWAVYEPLYGGRGVITGTIVFSEDSYSDLAGNLYWSRIPTPNFPDGIDSGLSPIGSRYAAPPAGTRALNFGNESNAGFVILDGEEYVGSAASIEVILGPDNHLTAASDKRFGMAISPGSGLYTGHMLNPNTNKMMSFSGVVVQKGYYGAGLSKYKGHTVSVVLQAQ